MLYLFFDTKPTKTNKYEKKVERIPITKRLCSISQKFKFKERGRLIQKLYPITNINAGITRNKNLLTRSIITICLKSNFNASAMN